MKNFEFFLKELPRLLKEHHNGQFVLVKDEQLVEFFVSFEAALKYGYQFYGDSDYIIQEIRDESKDTHFIKSELGIKDN